VKPQVSKLHTHGAEGNGDGIQTPAFRPEHPRNDDRCCKPYAQKEKTGKKGL
jgi:hypothetical protein